MGHRRPHQELGLAKWMSRGALYTKGSATRLREVTRRVAAASRINPPGIPSESALGVFAALGGMYQMIRKLSVYQKNKLLKGDLKWIQESSN
ncbi:hypothetical protein D4S03_04895 [bacterium]|nr:MAG: hypothetical protein D4S03_04895 [bacterium]